MVETIKNLVPESQIKDLTTEKAESSQIKTIISGICWNRHFLLIA